jgi:cytochrome c oxidase subunit II
MIDSVLRTTMKKWCWAALGLLAATLTPGLALGVTDAPGGPKVNQLTLHEPVTQIGEQIFNLHNIMLGVCLAIFVVVFGVMFYSIFAHRKSKGATPATWHESTKVEILWTVVPFIIVILMALPATKTVVEMKDTSSADLTIKATGYQWKWGYDYLKGEGEGISFLSNLATPREQIENTAPKSATYLMEVDNALVVPVNKKVRIVTTANDVIHSWAVPAFGVKQDAIPGFVRDTWFRAEKVGEYRGHCVELCGKDHAFMPIVVKVVSQQDYLAWAEGKKKEMAAKQDDPNKTWTADELKTRGQAVYTANCVACHQATGKGVPGAFAALDASPKVLGPKDVQINILLNGVVKNGTPTAMASFKQLSDVEIAAVITYTRQAWSNAGKGQDPVVQPAEVKTARK